jgi:hypothetical protein
MSRTMMALRAHARGGPEMLVLEPASRAAGRATVRPAGPFWSCGDPGVHTRPGQRMTTPVPLPDPVADGGSASLSRATVARMSCRTRLLPVRMAAQ